MRTRGRSAARAHREAPTTGGYAAAVAVSLVVLALEISVVDAIEEGTTSNMVTVVVVVLLFGAIPAAVLGSLGACLVHLLTRRHPSTLRAVTLAGATGLAAGLLVYRGSDIRIALMLAVAAAAGRWAVVPLQPHGPEPSVHGVDS
jgi:uncharacterized membrane protein